MKRKKLTGRPPVEGEARGVIITARVTARTAGLLRMLAKRYGVSGSEVIRTLITDDAVATFGSDSPLGLKKYMEGLK